MVLKHQRDILGVKNRDATMEATPPRGANLCGDSPPPYMIDVYDAWPSGRPVERLTVGN